MAEDLNDLAAFAVVAEARSFTRAAARLNVSPSALSQTIGKLEKRLGMRLLARTTRSVALTEAGERLFNVVHPRLGDIAAELSALKSLRDRPSGTIRITTSEHPALTILEPALAKLMPLYPDITVEVSVDYGLTDIVANRFDAGIRLGEHLAQDMIAVPISPPLRMAVVGSPAYFARHPRPMTPDDLHTHRCINIRQRSSGGLYAWEFEQDGREIRVRVEGQLTFNGSYLLIDAARAGFGIALVMEDLVAPMIADGSLRRVLEDWCPPFPGYHLYYPSRRQPSAAFSLILDALRFRG